MPEQQHLIAAAAIDAAKEEIRKERERTKEEIRKERERTRDLERLFLSGEIEAAKIIPAGVRHCRCDKCGCDPGSGFGFLVGWACELGGECPFGRPLPGVTLAEAMGMRTEVPDA